MKTSVRLLSVAIALLMVVSTAMAQNQERGRGNRGGFGGGRGGFGGGMDASTLLRNEKVQKELELSDDQVQQLTKIAEDSRSAFSDLRDLDRDQIGEKMREAREKTQKKIDEVLYASLVARGSC
jgi:Spy/CpxP family protein refolding chaperone